MMESSNLPYGDEINEKKADATAESDKVTFEFSEEKKTAEVENSEETAAPEIINAPEISEKKEPKKNKLTGALEKTGEWLYEKKYLGFCFLVPAAILLLMYFFIGVYPVGENSVLVLDLNAQYVYFFEALKDILTEGGSLLYSFRRALGGEFMGLFAYYLASPLNFIITLFGEDGMTEALLTLLLLKTGLSGFTFGVYLHKKRPRRPVSTVMFSTMWSLCAFAVVMQHNIMWTDCIILLPIIMLGIERIIETGKGALFIVSLSVAVFSNFYIGYMMCIFSALYFFAYYFSKPSNEINPEKLKAHFIRRLVKMGVCALVVVCICAVIILPTYYSLTFGKTEFSDPKLIFEQKNDFFDILTKFFFGSYDTVRPEGLPFLYTGTLTLLLLPLYFISGRIPIREKISNGLLMAVLLISMNGSTIDLFWHGMQKPNWLNYRYSFILCFFFVYLAFRAFEFLRDITFKHIIAEGAAISLLLFVLQKQDYENMPDLECIWASLTFIIIYVLVLRGVFSKASATHITAVVSLCIIVCFEMFASGLLNFYALDNDVVYSSRTGYRKFIDKMEIPVGEIKAEDDSFYRMEKTSHRKTNDNMALGIYGLTNSTSTLNESTIKFLNRMGFASKSHWSKYLGATEVSDSLLGIKYVIRDYENLEPVLYEEIKDYPELELTTYKNPYALSVAYGVSTDLRDVAFTSTTEFANPFERMNSLVGAMLGEETEIFKPTKSPENSMSNVDFTTSSGHLKYTKTDQDMPASVTFYVEAASDDPLYCYFPSDYTREVKFYVDGEAKGTYYGNDTYRIVKLGSFEAGESVIVRMELNKEELYIKDGVDYFYHMDSKALEEAMEVLSQSQFNVTSHTESALSGTINVKEGQNQIFTSIPYDEGWKITVDGERVEIYEALDALITFDLETGEHKIEMEYMPDSFVNGVLISLCGVSAFVLLESAQYVIRNKKSRRAKGVAK